MPRFIAAIALFLIALPSDTQTTEDRLHTAGLVNGRAWSRMDDASKSFYVAGSLDGITMACGSDQWKKLFASDLNVGDVVKSLNKFYEEPTNIAIPITGAMSIVKSKAEGASADSIEKATALFRQIAASPK